jgi:hypothetical protein
VAWRLCYSYSHAPSEDEAGLLARCIGAVHHCAVLQLHAVSAFNIVPNLSSRCCLCRRRGCGDTGALPLVAAGRLAADGLGGRQGPASWCCGRCKPAN